MTGRPAASVLLIGGAGFLGGHIARVLLAAGHRVTALSRSGATPVEGVHAITVDRRDPQALARALDGLRFDFTVDLVSFEAADVESLLLIPYAALGRYVLISTGQVYLVTENPQPPFREEDSDRPVIPEPSQDDPWQHGSWSYGVGKRRAETALLGLRQSYGMRATILRLPILQGERDGSLRLWAWLERMLDGGPILMPDGGTRLTRHLYAGDVAGAILRLLDSPPPREAVYNLAQPDVVSVRELVERVAHAGGFSPSFADVSWDELRVAGLDESCAPYAGRWASMLDASRAATEWGFVPTRLDEYLPRVVRWHLENRPTQHHDGYEKRAVELEVAAGRTGVI